MSSVTHRVVQGGNLALFDLLEIFQNITHMEHSTPATQQLQDHLMVNLVLRMLDHEVKHEIYCVLQPKYTQSYTRQNKGYKFESDKLQEVSKFKGYTSTRLNEPSTTSVLLS